MKKIGIVMGSDSDLPVIKKAADVLDALSLPYEVHIYSAHRTPDEAASFFRTGPALFRPGGARRRPVL